MKRIIFLSLFLSIFWFSNAQNQEVPFTLADRDRIIQTEAKVESLNNEMSSLRNEMSSLRNEIDARFEAVNSKIDYMYWVQGVIIALIIFMLGFIIWDRRTALDPVKTDVEVLKRENEKMKNIFRFLSETQPQLREILKNAGIL
jgi:prefoldin subunit 5